MSKEMDDRFSQVMTDPRFRTLRKSDKKVKVDKRFHKMFTEKRFKLKYSVDKRGKQTNDDNSDEYKKFYNLSDSEKEPEDVEEEDQEKGEVEEKEGKQLSEDINYKTLKRPKIPNARGLDSGEESEYSSSSESEDSSDENEELDHNWNEWDKDVPKTDSSTKRLAICNLDWDRINANDLFVLINSFKPSNGSIISVKIYPSELGKQRMKAEAERGPLQFIKTKDSHKLNANSDEDINEEEDQETDDPKIVEELRKYEMTKLQYFYAVVECDTHLTAEVLYNELDGMEYESSSTALDLRFIGDDISFEDESELKSECYSMPDLSSYKAPQFINSALQQSKVQMTWDQTDPKRKEIFERAFNKEEDDDIKAYLATSEEEEDEETQNFDSNEELGLKTKDKINKYKDLLNSLSEPKEDPNEENLEMEISWEPNLKDIAEDMVNKREQNKDMSAFEQNFKKKKEQRKQSKNNMTTRSDESEDDIISEKTVNQKSKHKERHKKKRGEQNQGTDPNLELLFMDSSDVSDKQHFNYKNIIENESNPKKRKPKFESFKFDAEDPRFGAVYTSHHYNVDPSDPHFKRTEAFEQIMNKSTKKIKSNESENTKSLSEETTKSSNSWTQLVRNVKNKSQSIQNRRHNKMEIKQNKFKS